MEFPFNINELFRNTITKLEGQSLNKGYISMISYLYFNRTISLQTTLKLSFEFSHSSFSGGTYHCFLMCDTLLSVVFLLNRANKFWHFRCSPNLKTVLDLIGEASRLAQNLHRPVTSANSFINSDQTLYMLIDPKRNKYIMCAITLNF